MSDVQFIDEQKYAQVRVRPTKGLIGMVMGWGLAANEKEAENILLVVAVVAIVMAVAAPFLMGGGEKELPVPEALREATFRVPPR